MPICTAHGRESSSDSSASPLAPLSLGEEHFRLIFQNISEGVAVCRLCFDENGAANDYEVVEINPAFEQHTGIPRGNAVGKRGSLLLADMDFPYSQIYSEVALTGKSAVFSTFYSPLGKHFEVSVSSPKRHWFIAVFSDVSARVRHENEIRESESKFRGIFESSRDANLILHPEGIWDCNQASVEMLGLDSKQELLAKTPWGFSPRVQPEGGDSMLGIAVNLHEALVGEAKLFEWTFQRENGCCFPAEVLFTRIRFGGKSAVHAVVRDITERKKSELHLRNLSRAVEQSSAMILITDLGGRIEYANPKFCAVTGYSLEETLGNNPRMLKSGGTPAEVYQEFWSALRAGKEWRGEFLNRKKNGELFWDLSFISPISNNRGEIVNYLAIKEDITERKAKDERIQRAHRLESIGALASGIAHDLNNILAPIVMSAALLREQATDEATLDLVSTIEEAAARGSEVVKEIVSFARGVRNVQSNLAPRDLVDQIGRIIRKTFPKSIEFSVDLPEDLWNITGDLTKLHQVLLNLCVNARDAMPEGGTLTIRGTNCQLDAPLAASIPGAAPGRYLQLSVIDSGSGIPEPVLAKIFDPFFTTKAQGEGTGLGLSIVLDLIKEHKGFVQVSSGPGQGTAFHVFLPATLAQTPTPVLGPSAQLPQGEGRCILLVDDEAAFLAIMGRILLRNGYHVITATGAKVALQIYAAAPAKFAAAVTDLMMPEMDGVKLARQLLELNPQLPIIASSGYPEERFLKELEDLGICAFLKKPYPPEELLRALHQTSARFP